jgi:hypothetical protein
LIALARPFGTSLAQEVQGGGFRTFASKRQNGFVGARIVSSRCRATPKIFETGMKKGQVTPP